MRNNAGYSLPDEQDKDFDYSNYFSDKVETPDNLRVLNSRDLNQNVGICIIDGEEYEVRRIGVHNYVIYGDKIYTVSAVGRHQGFHFSWDQEPMTFEELKEFAEKLCGIKFDVNDLEI